MCTRSPGMYIRSVGQNRPAAQQCCSRGMAVWWAGGCPASQQCLSLGRRSWNRARRRRRLGGRTPPGADVFAAWLVLLLGDVLAPPAHALTHVEGGVGVHVGRGDALALLVGDLPARARWDLVDSMEDLVHLLVEAFLGLGLAALIRRHQTLRLLLPARVRPRAQVGAGALRRRMRLLRVVPLVHL